jgi:hypothetical protein
MTLTQPLAKLGTSVAVFGIVGGFVAISAETASAASVKYTVDADILQLLQDGSSGVVGNVVGGFKFNSATGTFSDVSLTSKFTGGIFSSFPEQTYDTVLNGTVNTLSANNASFAPNVAGISLVFPSLNTIPIGSTRNLLQGSVNFGQTTPPFNFSAYLPLEGSVTAVPTPALLPGLVGMGLAALRRKKSEEAVEENA